MLYQISPGQLLLKARHWLKYGSLIIWSAACCQALLHITVKHSSPSHANSRVPPTSSRPSTLGFKHAHVTGPWYSITEQICKKKGESRSVEREATKYQIVTVYKGERIHISPANTYCRYLNLMANPDPNHEGGAGGGWRLSHCARIQPFAAVKA